MVVAFGAVVVVEPGVVELVEAPGTVVVDDLGVVVVDDPLVSAMPEFRTFLPASVGGNLQVLSPAVAFDMKSRQILAGNVPPATDWPLKDFISLGCSNPIHTDVVRWHV